MIFAPSNSICDVTKEINPFCKPLKASEWAFLVGLIWLGLMKVSSDSRCYKRNCVFKSLHEARTKGFARQFQAGSFFPFSNCSKWHYANVCKPPKTIKPRKTQNISLWCHKQHSMATFCCHRQYKPMFGPGNLEWSVLEPRKIALPHCAP